MSPPGRHIAEAKTITGRLRKFTLTLALIFQGGFKASMGSYGGHKLERHD